MINHEAIALLCHAAEVRALLRTVSKEDDVVQIERAMTYPLIALQYFAIERSTVGPRGRVHMTTHQQNFGLLPAT